MREPQGDDLGVDDPSAPAPKLVLMAIADEADDTGFCFPSQRRLARKCNVTERSVRRIVGKLIAAQHVVVEARFRRRSQNGAPVLIFPRAVCTEMTRSVKNDH